MGAGSVTLELAQPTHTSQLHSRQPSMKVPAGCELKWGIGVGVGGLGVGFGMWGWGSRFRV